MNGQLIEPVYPPGTHITCQLDGCLRSGVVGEHERYSKADESFPFIYQDRGQTFTRVISPAVVPVHVTVEGEQR